MNRLNLSATSAFVALLALAGGCSADAPIDEEPAITSCDLRLTELVDGACPAVTVSGITSEEITFERAGLTLHGTITYPQVEGAYQAPGVVLVHGSGAHGRDGALDGSLGVPFGQTVEVHRDLAEKLAWQGVATVRYEKRSCFKEGASECTNSIYEYPGDLEAMVVDDFLEDARAAAHRLADHPEVRDDDIIVAGHSQGGNFVPRLVKDEAIITGGIGLGSPALSLTETMVGQVQGWADHLKTQGATLYAADIAQLESFANELATDLPSVLDGSHSEPTYLNAPLVFWQSWDAMMASTEQDVIDCGQPLLFLNGEWDFNVWPAHLDTYASFAANATSSVDTQLLPGLTHAFVSITGTPPQVDSVDPQFSPAAVDAMVDWLVETDPALSLAGE